jgi:hypothetical protein
MSTEPNGHEHVRDKLRWLDQVMFDPKSADTDLAVAYVIAHHVRREYGDAVIDQKRIADLLRIGERSVRRSLDRLEANGHLAVKAGHGLQTNRYRWVLSNGQSGRLRDEPVDDPVDGSNGQNGHVKRPKSTSQTANRGLQV